MYRDLEGKIVIVTGAAQGIGEGIARAFVNNGAVVVVSDFNEELGKATAAALGGDTSFVACNIADSGQVHALVDTVVERFGRLDVMVNNAGTNSIRPEDRVTIDSYSNETWLKMINVNLTGTFFCCKAASAQMVRQGFGSIINISSIAGVIALRLQIGFVAAKAGMLKMTEAMACELGPLGVRVNAVSPGSTLTAPTRKLFYDNKEAAEKILSFIPQRRVGEVEEVADAVVFLASDSASYINGQNVVVDGGWICGFSRDF